MSSKIAIDQGIDATIMGIRECLMDYFNDGCIDRMTSGNIVTHPVEMSADRRYLRNRMVLDRYTVVLIQDIPVLVMLSNPSRVILQTKVFDRSREFRRVGRGVERALREYFKHVTVEVNEKSEMPLPGRSGETLKLQTRKGDDVALVTANSLRKGNDRSFEWLSTTMRSRQSYEEMTNMTTTTLRDQAEAVAEYNRSNPPNNPVLGMGWHASRWDSRGITSSLEDLGLDE